MTVKQEYAAKAAILAERGEKMTPLAFYRELFPVGSFEREGHPEDGRANAVVVQLGGPAGNVRRLCFDDLQALQDVQGAPFAVCSAVSYSGLRRTGRNARWMFALVVDLDDVGPQELRLLLGHIGAGHYPAPSHIVNSGHGLHLYYMLERPVPMFPQNQTELHNIKTALTRRIWNDDTSRLKTVQYQGITQGFRVVGSCSKLGKRYPVTAFRVGKKTTLDDICAVLDVPNMVFEPEEYKPRASGKTPTKYHHWAPYVNRALYDWWLERIKTGKEVAFHHRYWCAHALVVFAVKCGVSRSELKEDLWSLLPMFNRVRDSDAFTEADLLAALRSYREEYRSYPRAAIEQGTAVPMPANKRNGRKQAQHLQIARAVKTVKVQLGESSPGGWPSKGEEIKAYFAEHPGATVTQAARELGISRPTIYKYRG